MVGRRPEVRGFELQEFIGRGGFSTVYRAQQPRLNRVVAVKVIDADIQADEDARRRFERECQTMGSLTGHHAVVTVHEVGECVDGQPYIAMELLEGGSLQDRLAADGVLPWPEVAGIGSQIAEALDAAHELGILHRDVKPANVMRDRFGRHKLGDFGIAGLAASAHTTAGAAPATVAYAAPEVLLGKRATASSDLYGLGATLYALLSGGPAFAAETDESVVPMVMRITRDPLPELDDSVAPPPLRSLLVAMMAKDPADRPADAASVVSALKTIEAAHLLGETQARVPADLATTLPAAPVEAGGASAPAREAAPAATVEMIDPTVLRVPKAVADRTTEHPAPPSADGPRPDIGRRVRAVALDFVLLGVVLAILAGLVLPVGEPQTNVKVTVRPNSVSVDRRGLAADDFATTLTVENTRDAPIRLALQNRFDEESMQPEGGAAVAAGQSRTFGIPKLEASDYDVVLLGSGGNVSYAVDGAAGNGMIEATPRGSLGLGTFLLLGFLAAALVLAFGWPIVVVPGVVAAATFANDPTDAWIGANAGFLLGATVVAFVVEVVVRAVRRGSVGESVAKIRVRAADGDRATIGRLVLRWIAKPLSAIPVFAGYWLPQSQTDPRTWHDRIAGVDFRVEDPTAGPGKP